ncbi:MAG TPA: tellurite resistance/C4-dicarboxylate transporter family protein [Pseudomonadales bacterium]
MRLEFARGPADRLETLHPASFALVMATGIVALALASHRVPYLPALLLALNVLFFVTLTVAYGWRIVRHREAFLADLRNHNRGVGFFTLIAAAAVLGQQLLVQLGWIRGALVLWGFALLALVAITYGVLALLTVQPDKPPLAQGIHGGWLLCVVAPQSVSILTVLLAGAGALGATAVPMFFALALWLGGGVLYLWLMTVIFFRYTFLTVSVDDLTPPYWISMGAVAISTLAGSTLVEHAALSPVVTELATFVAGVTLLFWSIGSWWIPMLVLLGIWRYLIRGLPLRYDPLYWGGVFPLGMYSVCTYHLAGILEVGFLMPLSRAFMLIAALAWTLALAGLVASRLPRRSAAESSAG